MRTFLTGATGYLGGYVLHRLLEAGRPVTALVRARSPAEARDRLWRSLQLHAIEEVGDVAGEALAEHLAAGRLRFVRGDLRAPRLGQDEATYERLLAEHDAVVHAAATLNRRSSRACFDVNLRGGLEVLHLARRLHERGRLRRYVHVSTVAIAGKRPPGLVGEDQALDWSLSDWDPYARTKKFGEHLVAELLPDAPTVIVRPSIVLGDSRFPATTQFDMAHAFSGLARLRVLPFRPEVRLDIVPADFVADAIAWLATAPAPRHRIYHLSAGAASPTFAAIDRALQRDLGRRPTRFAPWLGRACASAVHTAAGRRGLGAVQQGAALLDVFWPYLEWDVVFDNARIAAEAGLRPAPFPDHCAALLTWCRAHRFRYPLRPTPAALTALPAAAGQLAAEPAAVR